MGEPWISSPHQVSCNLPVPLCKKLMGSIAITIKFGFEGGDRMPQLRLLVHTLLCLFPDSVALMGPCCSSWGIPARYTTMRSFINAMGASHLPFVREANQTICLNLGCRFYL